MNPSPPSAIQDLHLLTKAFSQPGHASGTHQFNGSEPPHTDRIDPGADIEDLINSIQEHGQQVPILVRRLPDGDMEIVFGVRRVLACLALRIDVRAEVKEMSDLEALIAKGIENNERLHLSPSRPEDAGDGPPCETRGCSHIDSAIDGDTLTFTVRTECQAELLDILEDKIADLYAEWERSRDQLVSASTQGRVAKLVEI